MKTIKILLAMLIVLSLIPFAFSNTFNDVHFTNGTSSGFPGVTTIGAEVVFNFQSNNTLVYNKAGDNTSAIRLMVFAGNTSLLANVTPTYNNSANQYYYNISTILFNTSQRYGFILWSTSQNTRFVNSNEAVVGNNLNYTRGSFYSASATTYQVYANTQIWGFDSITSTRTTPPGGANITFTAVNYYNGSAINSFCVNITGNFTCTTNGTATVTTILTNSTQLWTVEYRSNESGGYFNTTYTGVNVSSTVNRSMAQSAVSFSATSKVTGATISATFNTSVLTNQTHYFNNQNRNVSAVASGYYTKTVQYNVTPLVSTTYTFTDMYDLIANISANTYSGVQLKNFTVTVSNAQFGFSESGTTTNGSLPLQLSRNVLYNITVITNTNDFPYNVTYTNVNLSSNFVFNYSILNITMRNAITNASVSSFSAQINSTSFGTSQARTTTNGTILYVATVDNFSVFADASGYAYTTANVTTALGMTNLTIYAYTTESVNFKFYDEQSNQLITNKTIVIEFIGSIASYNYSTANGTLYVDLLTPDSYTIRYGAHGYATRFYYVTIGSRTTQNVSLYLLAATNGTNVTATVYYQDGNLVSGALVKILKYNISQNSYITMGQIVTGSEGTAIFDVQYNSEYYKFMVESPIGTVALLTDPAYITQTTIPLIISTGIGGGEYFQLLGTSSNIVFNQVTGNFRYDWSDTSNVVEQACLYVYRLNDNYTGVLINSSCTTGTGGGSLVVSFTNTSGFWYWGEGWLTIDGVQYKTDTEWADLRAQTQFSQLGLIVAVVLTFVISFAGFALGPRGFVLLLPVGLTITQLLGITYFSFWVPFGLWAICIIILFGMGRVK